MIYLWSTRICTHRISVLCMYAGQAGSTDEPNNCWRERVTALLVSANGGLFGEAPCAVNDSCTSPVSDELYVRSIHIHELILSFLF
jgi:hypothetical protein